MPAKVHRNLLLGVGLVLAASAALLLSDSASLRDMADAKPSLRPRKVYLIQYNNVVDVQDAEAGVLEGLRTSGLVEGRDYKTKVLNAQGDMSTVSALIDAATNDRADLLITFSTPTLQAAIRRAPPSLPIVFTYVASAIAAGAGHTDQDHLPNVTGVSTGAAYDDLIGAIHQWFPQIKHLGTLYVPAEANMVFHSTNLQNAARKQGLELIVVPVNTASDVADAATALLARDVDAICQIPGNLTAAGFASISRVAHRAHIPVFAFQREQAQDGSLLVMARDYRDAGREAAGVAAQILRGDSPRTIPFRNFNRTTVIVNLDVARDLGTELPTGLVDSAQELVEDGRLHPARK